MFAKGLGLLISIVGVLWLGIAGAFLTYRYERLPVGWPNVRLNLLVLHPTLHAPGAGAVTALAARLANLGAQERAAAARAAAVAQAQAKITSDANAREVVVQTKIRTVTKTLIQQVPYAVPPAVDPLLSVGWLRLHDAAAGGVDLPQTPTAAGGADASVSATRSSDALRVVIGNYGAANSCRAQLTGLQDWLVKVEAAP